MLKVAWEISFAAASSPDDRRKWVEFHVLATASTFDTICRLSLFSSLSVVTRYTLVLYRAHAVSVSNGKLNNDELASIVGRFNAKY